MRAVIRLFLSVFPVVLGVFFSIPRIEAKTETTREEWLERQKKPTMAPEYVLNKWIISEEVMRNHTHGILPQDVKTIDFLRGPPSYWNDVRNGEGIECTKLYKKLLYSPSEERLYITAQCGNRYAGYRNTAIVEVWRETERSKRARGGKIRPPSEFELVGAWDLPSSKVVPARIEGGVAVAGGSKTAPMPPQGGSVAQTTDLPDCTGKTGLALQLCKLERAAKSQPGAPDPSAIGGTVGR